MVIWLLLLCWNLNTQSKTEYFNVNKYENYRFMLPTNDVFNLESNEKEYILMYYDKEQSKFNSKYMNSNKPLFSLDQIEAVIGKKKQFDTLISGIINTWGLIVSSDIMLNEELKDNISLNEDGVINNILIEQPNGKTQEMKLLFTSINSVLAPTSLSIYLNGTLAIIFDIEYQAESNIIYPKHFIFKNNANEVILKLEVSI